MAITVIKALEEEDNGEIETVTRVIDELCNIDPDSTGFRYHESRSGQPTLGAAPDNLHLEHINAALASVSSYLDCVDTVLEQAIDHVAECLRG
jgi:hypothetical protein